jgi:uncharacterized membrane protein YebE (DUF533 family)
MQELYEGIDLTPDQSEWIVRGLLDLAAVDGIHDAERALISDFHAGESLEALAAKGFDAKAAATVFHNGGARVVEAFIVSCYLLIYADGQHSDAERARIAEYASALGLDHGALEELHVKARLYVLQSLAHLLWNRDTVKEIGASMGLTEDHINRALEK